MAHTEKTQQEPKISEESADKLELVQPTAENPDPHGIYIDEVQGRNRRMRKLISFTHSSTRAAGVMLLAAIAALIVANTAAYEPFYNFWHHTEVILAVGPLWGEISLAHMINDMFMAVFFLLVGIEIKYEMTVGELTNIRQAALPIMGAIGGVAVPIVIYLLFNAANPQTIGGWGVPTATDIAFALGILALLGSRVPSGIRVFLSTLAVADDIIAILVIAIFYGESPNLGWLAAAAVVFIVLVVMNRKHVYSLVPYMLVGCILWFCVYMSGVHATISGVLLAFVIPSGSRINMQTFLEWSGDRVQLANKFHDEQTPIVAQKKYLTTVNSLSNVSREVLPPVTRLEHKLYPWVYFAILPLFALTNADVSLVGGDIFAMLTSNVVMGVFFGLVVGKPLGIMLMSFLCVKLHIAKLPEGVNWMHMLGASILGGVGFTMAIFVANLAYTSSVFVSEAKLAILLASLFAGVVGFLFLFMQASKAEKHSRKHPEQ
ncbi:Na+/H+ antiporter NhaA [Adlercreutzia sp. ZJ154]|uniref:Na+/H+ antiporter NhaA n=1 Tax=Adlercreutzia sp. ZJ154 TaxID=2709790 RepID=UPI0013ED9338|nr:Na+/H+ antiporter NhaA [Adlercreutzia sp. ZJ154]